MRVSGKLSSAILFYEEWKKMILGSNDKKDEEYG